MCDWMDDSRSTKLYLALVFHGFDIVKGPEVATIGSGIVQVNVEQLAFTSSVFCFFSLKSFDLTKFLLQ